MSVIQEIIDELEALGLVRKAGHMRPDPTTGLLQPVYVSTEVTEEEALKRLEELNRGERISRGKTKQ